MKLYASRFLVVSLVALCFARAWHFLVVSGQLLSFAGGLWMVTLISWCTLDGRRNRCNLPHLLSNQPLLDRKMRKQHLHVHSYSSSIRGQMANEDSIRQMRIALAHNSAVTSGQHSGLVWLVLQCSKAKQ